MGTADDANLYRYVGNYVTGAADPSGLYRKGLGTLFRRRTHRNRIIGRCGFSVSRRDRWRAG
ncbi:MAG: hypothetical protein KDA63_10500 [Planctomycetales bacterium]|nr:hypothetical protein [Planctomycetales bacterium]